MHTEDDDKFRYYKRVSFFPATCNDCGVKIGFFEIKHKVLINHRLTYLCTKCKDLRINGKKYKSEEQIIAEKAKRQIEEKENQEAFELIIKDELVTNYVKLYDKFCLSFSIFNEEEFTEIDSKTTVFIDFNRMIQEYKKLIDCLKSEYINGFSALDEINFTSIRGIDDYNEYVRRPRGYDFIKYDFLNFYDSGDIDSLFKITKLILMKYGNIRTEAFYSAIVKLATDKFKKEIKKKIKEYENKEDFYTNFLDYNTPEVFSDTNRHWYKKFLELNVEVLYEEGLIENNDLKLFLKELKDRKTEMELESFERHLVNEDKVRIGINDIDLMTGIEFEHFIGRLLENMGYSAEVTKASGDQGADLIIKKNNLKTVVQAKCYSGSVSNKAIQEVVASIKYYKADGGMVVTNSTFTKGAKELADSNDVRLIDRNRLVELLDRYEV